jgi:hypothetical protein
VQGSVPGARLRGEQRFEGLGVELPNVDDFGFQVRCFLPLRAGPTGWKCVPLRRPIFVSTRAGCGASREYTAKPLLLCGRLRRGKSGGRRVRSHAIGHRLVEPGLSGKGWREGKSSCRGSLARACGATAASVCGGSTFPSDRSGDVPCRESFCPARKPDVVAFRAMRRRGQGDCAGS